jgi:hypothetical protein
MDSYHLRTLALVLTLRLVGAKPGSTRVLSLQPDHFASVESCTKYPNGTPATSCPIGPMLRLTFCWRPHFGWFGAISCGR